MPKYNNGDIINGTVSGIEPYGIFISFSDGKSGLIHISELSHSFVKNVGDYAKVGDKIFVEILNYDSENKKYKLSVKNIDYKNKEPKRNNKIIETKNGFKTLAKNLPIWIEENLKKQKITK